jgi:hypothetical protein
MIRDTTGLLYRYAYSCLQFAVFVCRVETFLWSLGRASELKLNQDVIHDAYITCGSKNYETFFLNFKYS